MTIVTAADQKYWRCLYQFLRSGERLSLPARHRFIAYDLGLNRESLNQLERRFSWCRFRRFGFSRYPAHLAANLRNHAWKPFVLYEVMHETAGLLLWLDSATLFRHGFEGVASSIRRYGIYTLAGQSAIADHCDADILDALALSHEMRGRPERVSGIVGVDCAKPAARKLVTLWRDYHLDPAHVCVATSRHKSDQALLSIALFKMESDGEFVLPSDEVDISSRRPVRWLTTRNKVAEWMPLWADSAVRLYYRVYKRLDRLWLSWCDRSASLANGLHRASREHFAVFVASPRTNRAVRVKASWFSYYADPFLYRHDGKLFLFCERFRYLRHRGDLCCIPLSPDLRPGRPQTVLRYEHHASFPFLFEASGRLFLLPETSAEGGIHLYACDSFPHAWTRRRTLVAGIDAADTVLFRHERRFWLITSIRLRPDNSARYLALYSSDDLLSGVWQPHPVNQKRLYADLPFSAGRNAGPVIDYKGELLRPAQRNKDFYGERVRWMKINRLTSTDYAETEVPDSHPLARLCATPMHHISVADGFAAWDVRDRVGLLSFIKQPGGTAAPVGGLSPKRLAEIAPFIASICNPIGE